MSSSHSHVFDRIKHIQKGCVVRVMVQAYVPHKSPHECRNKYARDEALIYKKLVRQAYVVTCLVHSQRE